MVKRNSLLFIALLSIGIGCKMPQVARQSLPRLDLSRQLQAGESHVYSFKLNAGELLHLKIIQQGIDVVATIKIAGNDFSQMYDSPTGELDAEDVYLLAEKNEQYSMELIPAQKFADAGLYNLQVIRREKATQKDRKWMAALNLTKQADKLRTKAETREQSIIVYKNVAEEWKQLKDTVQQASALRSLGFMQIRQKRYGDATQTFTSLLPVWNQLGDLRGTGFT
jgi:hypothetical protein